MKETSCKAEAKKNIPAEENKTKEINSSMRFPLFYSPKPRSQGRSLIYWNWAFGVIAPYEDFPEDVWKYSDSFFVSFEAFVTFRMIFGRLITVVPCNSYSDNSTFLANSN